ncbi:MAG TPA: ABC transporter permease [Acidimicrobiales bacterium]|nr:ABC transporter permease [Acidimicrobiales bacterium]
MSEAGVPPAHELLDEVAPLELAPAPARELPARVVAARVSLPVRLKDLWRSRELFLFLVRKELKVKYKGSILGFLWSMLNPAVVLVVYYVVFTYFLKANVPDYALFLFSGLLVWNLFNNALMGSSTSIVAAAGIVKKVAFPREILAMSQVGAAVVFFGFQLVVMAVFLAGFQVAPAWSWLPLVPFALVDLVVLTAAIAIFLSAVNVYLRDIEHLIAVLLQAWFWGVPIIYSFNKVYTPSHRWLGYLYLADPITPIVLAFQRAFYGKVSYVTYADPVHHLGRVVSYQLANYPYHFYLVMLAWVLGIGVVLLLGALVVFGRIEGNFAEEL